MFRREITESVTAIPGIAEKTAAPFLAAGIVTLGDLLAWYPRRYDDRTEVIPLREYYRREYVCTTVRVIAQTWFGFGKMKTLKVYIEDENDYRANRDRAVLVCFRRERLQYVLKIGEKFYIKGKFFYKYGELQSTAFEIEHIDEKNAEKSANFGKIVPVYPLKGKLSTKMLRKAVEWTLEKYGEEIEDEIPAEIRAKNTLLTTREAYQKVHFPATIAEADAARRTLIYGELFYLEMLIAQRTAARRAVRRAMMTPLVKQTIGSKPDGDMSPLLFSPLQKRLIERLPFSLTQGQIGATLEINADMESPFPMSRLLQGDVGSGKTLVAFLACLRTVDFGEQAVIMAPTELLARQHAENAARLLEPLGVRVAFLTSNVKAKSRAHLLSSLADGTTDIVIGTHALFSRDVHYKALGLAVIDEQHRFGVMQRQAILAKGMNKSASATETELSQQTHLLMMSATPIPRSLSLTLFGDMDISIIKELPVGRKPVITHLARQMNEQKVYDFVRNEVRKGRQAYFVYPLISEADEGMPAAAATVGVSEGEIDENGAYSFKKNPLEGLKAAETMYTRLKNDIFPEFSCALAHSKVEGEEKKAVMEDFSAGKTHILVATSVVEVGVDVPNATIIVIEHAERFGLSALHQLRGRVGRGTEQSYCFLVYSDEEGGANDAALTKDGVERLKVMMQTNDGFVIAEKDLRLRGPGQINGVEQSGYVKLGIAEPIRDYELLEIARDDAFALLENDSGLHKGDDARVAEVLLRAPPFGEAGV